MPSTTQAYVRSLRNPAKRAYAMAYADYLARGEQEGREPRWGALSYMAAQAVRMNLHAIQRGEG